MSADRHNKLSSWRQVAGISEPETGERVRERLARRHRLLRDLLLDTIAELDLSYYAVSQYLDQGERSVPHEEWLDERTAYALGVYERAVAEALRMATRNGLEDLPREREVVRTVYIAPPPAKSWLHRLLFGG
jgi:hypothetical protein